MNKLCFLLLAVTQSCFADGSEGEEALKSGAYNAAIEIFTASAEGGDIRAQNGLASAYYQRALSSSNASNRTKDLRQALLWFQKAAEQGNAKAQYDLANMYTVGEGVEKNPEQAVLWFRKSADQGFPDSQIAMGVLFSTGEGGVPQNNAQAVFWFRNAADQGNADGQFALGDMYMRAEGVALDYKAAVALFRKAAEQKQPDAMLSLGEMYLKGHGVKQDIEEAAKWYSQAPSDDKDTVATREKVNSLVNHVRAARADVIDRLSDSASKSRVCAQDNDTLDFAHLRGDRALELKSYSRAMEVFKPLAEQGNASAECVMGKIYLNGWGVPQNQEQAAAWYRKAADHGNAHAASTLGSLYIRGLGVPKNFTQAAMLFCKAAQAGDYKNQNKCGIVHEYGEGVPKDYAKASAWYRKSAEQGYANAQYSLGNLYYRGQGVPRDFERAAALYQQAADQNLAAAHFSLGLMKLYGRGVPENPEEAERLIRRAASLGDAWARGVVKKLDQPSSMEGLNFLVDVFTFGEPTSSESTLEKQFARKEERQRHKNSQWASVWEEFDFTEVNSVPCAVNYCFEFTLSIPNASDRSGQDGTRDSKS